MKQTMLAFVLSTFALSFFVAEPAVALSDRVATPVVGQNVAQCIADCKRSGNAGSNLCIERCKKMK